MADAAAPRVQAQPGRIPPLLGTAHSNATSCDIDLANLYDNATYSAHVMLTRAVDADKEDYMAQRSTALPPPATPTGTATTGS